MGACGLLTRAPPPRAPPWPWRRRFSEVLVFAGQGSSWHPQERRRVAKRTCCATKLSSPWRTSHRARAIDKPFTCVWHVRWNSKCVMCPFKGEVAGAIFEAKREVRACFGMQHPPSELVGSTCDAATLLLMPYASPLFRCPHRPRPWQRACGGPVERARCQTGLAASRLPRTWQVAIHMGRAPQWPLRRASARLLPWQRRIWATAGEDAQTS